MIERALLALSLIVLGLLLYKGFSWAVLRRRARAGLGIDEYRLGLPAILYFTDPGCAPCLTVQDPALAEVQESFGVRLQIIRVPALERRDLTDAWGVLSLPTTFIIDAQGRPRRVNHGVTRAPQLVAQLESVGLVAEPARPAEVESLA